MEERRVKGRENMKRERKRNNEGINQVKLKGK
jgi:hypothetical protein